MIVADTNLVSYLCFDTIYSEEADAVHECDADWMLPILWRSEFVNVVSHYLRRNIISYSDGIQAIDFSQRIVSGREFSVSQYTALELVSESKCSAYDCEFVALAKELNCNLVTYDQKILREFPSIAISAKEFLKRFKK